MYGDVDKYYKSLIIAISKAKAGYNQDHAVRYFKKISELALIKNDKNINKLVKKLADKEIPILIIPEPVIPDKLNIY